MRAWLERRPELARSVAVFAALLVGTFALYAPALRGAFIADDLTNLRFVRTFEGRAWDFWIPGRAFGAPVTRSRFMPLHVAHWWAADRLFGDAAWAYHAASLALHALVATLVGLLVRAAFRASWSQAFAAAAAFAAWRVHAQAVVWISVQFRLLATALMLASLLVALAPAARGRRSIVVAVALFATGLLANPDLVVGPVPFAAFAWSAWRRGDLDRARRLAVVAAATLACVIAFVAANAVTNARHPDSLRFDWLPRPDRLAAFLANLIAPFGWPLVAKLVLAVLVAALLVRFREPATGPLVASSLASAALWAAASYDVAPRYLYLPAAFATAAITRAAARALERRPPAAAVAVAALLVAHAGAVRSADLPRFEYLSVLPRRLAAVAAGAPGARVLVTPDCPLPDADLAFFDRLRFVRDRAAASVVVDTGIDAYRARYGPTFAATYWDLPWLATTP